MLNAPPIPGTIQDLHLPLLLFRCIHKAHMIDMWIQVKAVYDKIVKNPPKDKNLCPCVNDHRNNGVLDASKVLIERKGSAIIGDPDAKSWSEEIYSPASIQDYWIGQMRQTFLDWYDPKLEVDTYGAAMFIYCKLKQPPLDAFMM